MRGGFLWTLGGEPRGRRISWIMLRLIPRKSARRFDRADLVEIEIADGLPRRTGRGVAKGFGQGLEPLGLLGLQGDECGHRVLPTLPAVAAIGGSPIADDGRAGVAFPVARLAFRRGERMLALRLASSGHSSSQWCHVTELWRAQAVAAVSWMAGLNRPERRFSRSR
jgi:hypothetical protein